MPLYIIVDTQLLWNIFPDEFILDHSWGMGEGTNSSMEIKV